MNNSIIIAGGGPAGLMLACELRLMNVPVIVIEPKEEIDSDSCGMVLHGHSVELLKQRGIADRFRNQNTPRWPRVHFGLFWLDLDEFQDREYNLLVPQSRTQQLLEERARELGAEIRRGQQVVSVEQDEEGVTVEVGSNDGVDLLRGPYMAVCDGAEGRVASMANIDVDTLAPAYYGVMADVPIDDTDYEEFEAGLYESGQFGILPIRHGEVRLMTVEFTQEGRPKIVGPVTLDELLTSIYRITGKRPDIRRARWIARFGHPTRLARAYRNGRIFVVGDAAHAHFPSAGHGLNTALNDSANLGWKLAAAMNGWAPGALLDSYDAERREVGRRACMSAQAQVALMYPLSHVEGLRNIFGEIVTFPEVNKYLVQNVTNASYRFEYDGQDVSDIHPMQGKRFPDVELKIGGERREVSSLLHSGRGVVVTLREDANYLIEASGWSDRVDFVSAAPETHVGVETLVIRPDGWVAWASASAVDPRIFNVVMRTWFGRPRSPRE